MKEKEIQATAELLAEMDALQIFGGLTANGDQDDSTQFSAISSQIGCTVYKGSCTVNGYCTQAFCA